MRRTVLDIMLHVAELGLLRANKDELKRIEDYMDDWCDAEGFIYKVTEHGVFMPAYINGEIVDEDVTQQVLKAIYGNM